MRTENEERSPWIILNDYSIADINIYEIYIGG